MLATPRRFVRSEPDERLVALVRDGDRNAFEEVYDRHSPGLLSFCRHMLGSLEEAEDAVQHTFLAAHRAMLADQRELHLKAWLYAIARNRCLSLLRARRERVGLEDGFESAPSVAGLATEVERREDLRDLLSDLARLPDAQRAALVLAELGAHTHDEIAGVLDVKRDKVKALVFQAREALVAAKAARDTPCSEIREELANARGGALRRSHLRRHLESCAGCRAFRAEVQRQRAALALILPVIPSFALKQAVLGGAAATAAGLGGSSAAGGLAAAGGAKAAAAKVMVAAVVAGGAGGTGYVAIHAFHTPKTPPLAAAELQVPRSAAAQPSEEDQPVAVKAASSPSVGATPLPERRVRRHVRLHRRVAAPPARRPTAVGAERRRRRHRGHEASRPPVLAAEEPQVVTGDKHKPKKAKDDKPKHERHGEQVPASDEHRQDDEGDGQDQGEHRGGNDDHPRADPLKHDREATVPAPGRRGQDDQGDQPAGDQQGDQGHQGDDQQGDGRGGGGDSRLLGSPVPPADRQ